MPYEYAQWMIYGAHLDNNIRLSTIDQRSLPDHYFLNESDRCFYLMEYTAGKGYDFSKCNSLIKNLKKSPSYSKRPDYHYKEDAINECALMLRKCLAPTFIDQATFVPIPCSKAIGHPEYDDRIKRICRGISPTADVRDLVVQNESRNASHGMPDGQRQPIEDLVNIYRIDKNLCTTPKAPTVIAIVDDMLTTGRHFRAMEAVLKKQFPNALIGGIFIARRVPAASAITNMPYLNNTI